MNELMSLLVENHETETAALSEAKFLSDFAPQLRSKLYNQAATL